MNLDVQDSHRLEDLRETSLFFQISDFDFFPRNYESADSHSLARWHEAKSELLRIRKLEDDWDGEGSSAPDTNVVDGAIQFAIEMEELKFTPPHRTHLGVNGTIYFEWFSPEGYREFEVLGPGRAESRFVRKGSDTAEVFKVFPR